VYREESHVQGLGSVRRVGWEEDRQDANIVERVEKLIGMMAGAIVEQ
jgi:hypothetical protein